MIYQLPAFRLCNDGNYSWEVELFVLASVPLPRMININKIDTIVQCNVHFRIWVDVSVIVFTEIKRGNIFRIDGPISNDFIFFFSCAPATASARCGPRIHSVRHTYSFVRLNRKNATCIVRFMPWCGLLFRMHGSKRDAQRIRWRASTHTRTQRWR